MASLPLHTEAQGHTPLFLAEGLLQQQKTFSRTFNQMIRLPPSPASSESKKQKLLPAAHRATHTCVPAVTPLPASPGPPDAAARSKQNRLAQRACARLDRGLPHAAAPGPAQPQRGARQPRWAPDLPLFRDCDLPAACAFHLLSVCAMPMQCARTRATAQLSSARPAKH